MKSQQKQKNEQRLRRRRRIRAKVNGTAEKPRISVYKSNQSVYAQLIDDERAHTLISVTSRSTKGSTDTERAYQAGQELAKQASDQNITQAVFDRGGFIYTGRIKALADGVREGGIHV